MAIPTRELSIVYGSYTVGGSNTAALLDGQWTLDKQDDKFTLQFSFLVIAAIGATWSESDFASACVSAESAFRKPFVDLTVTQGSSTLLDLSQSTGKGLEVHSEIIKVEHPANTGRSRRYTVRISGGMPADNRSGADVFLRDFAVNVTGSPSKRRTVTMSGVYTANGSTGARATYTSNITTKASAILSALTGTFELIGTPREEGSYHDQTLSFSRTYQEVLFGQAGSVSDTAIVDQVFTLTKRRYSERNAPAVSGIPTGAAPGTTSDTGGGGGSSGSVQPLVEITADWAAFIDFSVTTDLDAIWTRVKSWAIGQMQAALGSGGFALTEDVPVRNPDNNRVTGRLVALGVDVGGSGVIRREYEDSLDVVTGRTLVPAWASDPETYFDYQGPKARTRTRKLVEDKVSGSGSSATGGGGGGGGGGGSGLYLFGFSLQNSIFAPGQPFPTFGGGSEYTTGIGGTSGTTNTGGGGGGGGIDASSTGGWVVLRGPSVSTMPTTIGLDGKTLSIMRTTTTWVEQYRVAAKARGGSGGAVTPSGSGYVVTP